MEGIQDEFGRNLRNARMAMAQKKDVKVTQVDVAVAVGLSRPTISRFENGYGNPTLKQIEKLADALNVRPSELLETD